MLTLPLMLRLPTPMRKPFWQVNVSSGLLCGRQPIVPLYFLRGINGVPSDAFYTTGCVLYILKHSKDAMEALRYAIHLGGDVDSAASLATGIIAARYGLDSLPSYMVEKVEGVAYFKTLAAAFARPRK